MKTPHLLIRAYIDLLKIQHESTRLHLEATYCVLRDQISRFTGRSSQEVQETCEQIALLERKLSS